MAQRRSLAWTELKVGLLVIASFAALSFVVVRIGGQTSLFATYRYIDAYFPDANGLKPGADVLLDGILIGSVDSVDFKVSPEGTGKVVTVLKIDETHVGRIRKDSEIGIDTKGLLGDLNIQISSGTGDPIGVNEPLYGTETGNIRRIITGTDDLIGNLRVLSETAVNISNSVEKGEGTLGKLLKKSEIHDNMNQVVLEAQKLVLDIRSGPGTAGKLINDDELYRRVNDLLARMDDVVNKIDRGEGTAGKLLNDPSLYIRVDELLARMDGIAERIDRGEGTLGRMIRDESLYNDARTTIKRVDSLVAAIETGDGTAGKLIKDPALFNNMNQAASEIQKLLYDIKQDPKKFLTINFRFF